MSAELSEACVSNELSLKAAASDFSRDEHKVLLAVAGILDMRHEDSIVLPLLRIAEIANLELSQVRVALTTLDLRSVLYVTPAPNNEFLIQINTNYDEWDIE